MKIADLVSKILVHLAQQIVDDPQIPGDIKNQMKNVTALVDTMRKDMQKGVKDLTGNLQNVGKNVQDVTKNLQDSGKQLQDANKTTQPKP